MTEYFIRQDGTQATFTSATGPSSNAANCMSPSTFAAGRAANLTDGDIVTVAQAGGDITEPLYFDVSGTSDYIYYRGEVSGATKKVIDLSGGAETDSPIHSVTTNGQYIDIDNFSIVGNSLANAVTRDELGTGSVTVHLGNKYGIVITSNNAGSTECDGFDWHGDCKDVCGYLEANLCTESTPASGAFQGFTPHDTCDVYVAYAKCLNNNVHVGNANTSKITFGVVEFGDCYDDCLVVGSGAAAGNGIFINGGTIVMANPSLAQINVADNPGKIVLKNMNKIACTGSGTQNTYGGTVRIENSNLEINSTGFSFRPLNGGRLEIVGCPDILCDDFGNEILNNDPAATETSGGSYDIRNNFFRTNNNWDGVSGTSRGRLIRDNSGVSRAHCRFNNNVMLGWAGDVDVIGVFSGVQTPPVMNGNQFIDIACDVFDIDTATAKDNNNEIFDNRFHNCTNPTQISNATYVDRSRNSYTGSSPDESAADDDGINNLRLPDFSTSKTSRTGIITNIVN